MYPQIPRELIRDPLGSTEHILRNTVLTLLASKNYTDPVLAKGHTTIPCILFCHQNTLSTAHITLCGGVTCYTAFLKKAHILS
jgi:hypothetical protein